MPLVDYPPSDSDSDAPGEPAPLPAETEPPAKRRKREPGEPQAGSGSDDARLASAAPHLGLPPLPPAFHDLYASTVRRSVSDDPSLHQGRKRQMPHVVGNWPTHVYIEWHPSRARYDLLVALIHQARSILERHGRQLHDFLTSDLGAPLPLHISLSRPLALDTAHKDDFLDKVSSAITACNKGPFSVHPAALVWYQSPDSNRTFLVLRVASSEAATEERGAKEEEEEEEEKEKKKNQKNHHQKEKKEKKKEERIKREKKSETGAPSTRNPELAALLAACNGISRRFDQPVLYHDAGQKNKHSTPEDAFHVSIGWTFGLAADDEAAVEAVQLFERDTFREMRGWGIDISGVKAKIGNVVSHVALSSRQPSKSLFGI